MFSFLRAKAKRARGQTNDSACVRTGKKIKTQEPRKTHTHTHTPKKKKRNYGSYSQFGDNLSHAGGFAVVRSKTAASEGGLTVLPAVLIATPFLFSFFSYIAGDTSIVFVYASVSSQSHHLRRRVNKKNNKN